MLAMAGRSGPSPRFCIVAAKQVQKVCFPQTRGAISQPLLVNQQRECDAGFLTKLAGVISIAESDGGQRCSTLLECLLAFAQLHDMLAAEDSPIMAQENYH